MAFRQLMCAGCAICNSPTEVTHRLRQPGGKEAGDKGGRVAGVRELLIDIRRLWHWANHSMVPAQHAASGIAEGERSFWAALSCNADGARAAGRGERWAHLGSQHSEATARLAWRYAGAAPQLTEPR